MTLQQMKYIIAIANYCSFSKAAKNLFVSQSTLSTAVKETEKNLGITIFQRNNRGVSLTCDGEDLIRYIRDLVGQADYLEQKYRSRKSVPTRFSVSSQHLPFATRAFVSFLQQIDIPAFDIAMRECDTYSVIRNVSDSRSELGVLTILETYIQPFERIFATYNLTFVPIASMRNYVFFRSSHPLADKKEVSLHDLAAYPFVTYDQSPESSHYTEESLFYESLNQNVHVCDRSTKIAMIRGSDAFSIGPDLTNSNADKFHSNLGEIMAKPLNTQLDKIIAGYLVQREHHLSDYGKIYLKNLEKDIHTIINFG
ncbi:LysR family transcriptional regulator [Anaerotruncus sp. 80]|uniref:LysR family transcriptional regulator n=1 Tax=Anaerotruncus colihominis TaxID=169435 RepID=A0A845QGM1_9FIRM|nr:MULTISPECIES: LysR family transcriptional regulator [Anaerotruncus]NBH61180.1 LysR family transcriptional regulator [Anaerotruncus colihominis]NCF01835.1 LysR family transcriptional regulator [Anaerotruncus sp. 80]